jgi:hypothetical protein
MIGDALSLVALVRLHDRVETRLRVFGGQQLRVAASARDGLYVADEQHVVDVAAPQQGVAVDVPVVGNLADRGENLAGVDRAGLRWARQVTGRVGHWPTVLGRPAGWKRYWRIVANHGSAHR